MTAQIDAQQVADAIRQTGRRAADKGMHATEFDCLNAAEMIERLQKVADERGESFARSIEDFNNMRDQRDAARSELETAKAVENTLSMEINRLQAEVERLKVQIVELRDGFDAEQAGIELRRAMDRMGR